MVRISVIQMTPTADIQRNIEQANALLTGCVREERPDIVCLPECWTCIGADSATTHANAERFPAEGSGARGDKVYEFLRGTAREHAIILHGGSIVELEGDRLFNTTVVFDRDGTELGRYRKIHMADFIGPDGTRYGESDLYAAGTQTTVFDAGGLATGCAICYDLRFPELFHALRREGAELIVLPAVFTLHTGKDHWETLIRARAIETQCWIAAADTYGSYSNAKGTFHTYGHSLICDPWGHVVAKCSDGPGWATARIDRALTATVRRQIPLMQHRKLIKA